MSIVTSVRDFYERSPKRKASTGWPTGSRFGTCTAQLQLLRYPDLGKAELPLPRQILTWEEGNRIEEWLASVLEQTFPNLTGLRQEPFYFRVPLDAPEMLFLFARIQSRRMWGTVVEKFFPPTIHLGNDGRVKLKPLTNKKMGFVLDQETQSVWAPTYIDFAMLHADLGLVILEAKSMSNFAFRRALVGNLDYGKRCQLVGIAEATGLDTVMIAYRKETAHLCEIAYTRKADHTRVTITKLNGQADVYFVQPGSGQLQTEAGEDVPVPADALWELAETWTPSDPALCEQVRQNVRDVLLFDGDPAKLVRRYGPDFTCPVCQGMGTQTLAKGSDKPLKTPKPCETCGESGVLEKTTLPAFPCGYCSVWRACWGQAGVELEVTDKPRYWVTREGFMQSGISFKSPDA